MSNLKCEAVEQGRETDITGTEYRTEHICGEPAEMVEIRGKIASVRATLCLFHQGVMSEEDGYLVVRMGEPEAIK